jgi:LuxR family maltose regulon positive regulatory protein
LPTNLLRTKLQIPLMRARLVPRPRLTAKLDEGVQHKFTLISATAGYGKTTLLKEWHQTFTSRQWPLAWLSLDANDSDWPRFWSYVIAAFQTVSSDLGKGVAMSLHSIPLLEFAAAFDEHAHRESILTAFLNELDALRHDLVLILDDYHVIKSPLIHESLAFFIDRMPGHLHVVLATREDPPLPLARWRAHYQLTEIRAADLRFTFDETADFFHQIMQVPVSDADTHILETRVEGWIAGLQMAALSLRERASPAEFIAAFSGGHRFILDYLSEEVLRRQAQEVRSFLLSTAILDRMNAALCDAVTGRADSQAMLERLEAANLFVVPLDDERRWYRYHRLFADLLRHQLQRAQAERRPELHRRASRWFENANLMPEAIQHAAAANDLERVADLIERATRRAWMPWMQGESGAMLSWLETLPSELIRSRPRLCLTYAWLLLVPSQLDRVEQYLRDATQAAGTMQASDQAQSILSEVAVVRTFAAGMRGEVATTIELAHQALASLPVTEPLLRSIVAWSLGNAYALQLDMQAAQHAHREALATSRVVGNHAVALMSLNQLAEIQCSLGQLHTCASTLHEAFELAKHWEGEQFFLLGRTWWTLALVHYEWDDLTQAEECLNHSIHIGIQWNYIRVLASAYGLSALVKQAQGDRAGAAEMIRRAQQAAQESRMLMAANACLTNQLWLWSAQGDWVPAMQWIREHEAEWSDQDSYLHLAAGTAIARVLIEYSRRQADQTWLLKAQRLLQERLQQAEATELLYDVIEILPIYAIAYHVQGQTARALALIKQALTLAEPEGYVRMFVNCGDLLAELLLIGLKSRTFGEPQLLSYITKLLARFEIPISGSPTPARVERMIESLTQRELEVLQLVAAGASDQAIADQLVLSKATVKTHLRNIYGKLQVGTRTQAIARARVLRWLP